VNPPAKLTLPEPNGQVTRLADHSGYVTPAGVLTPVTSILSATSPAESKARLEAWKQRLGADAERITANACRRGSWCHEQIENHLQGKPVAKHLAFQGYLNTMLPWVKENVVEPLAIEKPIWHPAGFSGTFDLLAFCSEWMDVTILDWKTSRRLRSPDLVDNYLDQLGAYSLGLQHTYGIRPTKGVLVIGRPVGTRPDVWEIDDHELARREDKFLSRVAQFHAIHQQCGLAS